jgi:hypothetical protein
MRPPPASMSTNIMRRIIEQPVDSLSFSAAIYYFAHSTDWNTIVVGNMILAERFTKSAKLLAELAAQVEPCWIIEIFQGQLLYELLYVNKKRHSPLVAYAFGHLHVCQECRKFFLGDRPKNELLERVFPKQYFAKPAKHNLAAVQ